MPFDWGFYPKKFSIAFRHSANSHITLPPPNLHLLCPLRARVLPLRRFPKTRYRPNVMVPSPDAEPLGQALPKDSRTPPQLSSCTSVSRCHHTSNSPNLASSTALQEKLVTLSSLQSNETRKVEAIMLAR